MKNFARVVSLLFHPMLLTSYAILLMFVLPTYLSLYPYNYKKAVVLIIFTATFISPLLIMLILLNIRKIKSLNLTDRKERFLPFVIGFVLYFSAYLITLNFPGGTPLYISGFVLCTTILLLILLILTFKFKISVHMAGMGGFIGFFYVFFVKMNISEVLFIISGFHILIIHFFVLLLILSGIIASARLFLKAHNPIQIISGFFTGLIIGFLSVFLY